MRKGPLQFAGALVAAFVFFIAGAARAADTFAEALQPANPAKAAATVAPPGAAAPSSGHQPQGTITIYTVRATFEAAFPGLTVEDFEEGNAPAGNFSVCDAPLDAAGDVPCGFAAGDILSGVAFQDSPGPDAAALILLGAGAALNPSQTLIANTFSDSFEILFDPPVNAAGMDLHSTPALGQGPPDILTIQVFDANDVLIDSDPAAAASGAGNFWGVSSPTPIGRISMLSTNARAEGVDNISFLGEPTLVASASSLVDACASNPGNANGIFEPGELLTFTVELTASGGAFSNISGVLTSPTSGVTIPAGNTTWPNLAAGASANNVAPLTVQLDAGIACASTFELDLAVSSTEGAFALSFTHDIGQALAPNVPVAIPDNDPAGIESTLVVADSVILTDVDVRVQINHTWVGDLLITLRAPDNTEVVLLDRPGVPASTVGCADNNMDVTFDDASATDLETHCATTDPWFVGTANPVGSLATFNGFDSAGTWRIFVSDGAGQDIGDIINWELITTPAIGGVCTVCVGGASEADLEMFKTSDAVGSVAAGDTVVYTLSVTNNGPDAAAGVVVTDSLPAGLVYVGNDCGAAFADPTLTWNIGALAAAGSVLCNITTTVDANAPDGPIVNSATVASSTTDPTPGNATSTTTINVGGASVVEVPMLDGVGMLTLLLGLGAAGIWRLRRRAA